MLLELGSRAINLWANLRERASQEEGVNALDFGLFVGIIVVTIVVAFSLFGGSHAMPTNDLNINYP